RVLEPQAHSGATWISAPAESRDAADFQGRLYVAGASGLRAYDGSGNLVAEYRPGGALPPAPLVALAVGATAGSSGPVLWIATRGEGLLSFDGQRFRQVRPAVSDARMLTTILLLPTGRVLFGTEKMGVLAFDGKQLDRFHDSLADFH